MMLLLKLIEAADPGDPGALDSYSLCRMESEEDGWTSGSIGIRRVYSMPPCGGSYYALISCVMSAETYLQGIPGGVRLGWWQTTDLARDCAISESWHPAIDGQEGEVGTRTKLF